MTRSFNRRVQTRIWNAVRIKAFKGARLCKSPFSASSLPISLISRFSGSFSLLKLFKSVQPRQKDHTHLCQMCNKDAATTSGHHKGHMYDWFRCLRWGGEAGVRAAGVRTSGAVQLGWPIPQQQIGTERTWASRSWDHSVTASDCSDHRGYPE